jgi:hypothetical protein
MGEKGCCLPENITSKKFGFGSIELGVVAHKMDSRSVISATRGTPTCIYMLGLGVSNFEVI